MSVLEISSISLEFNTFVVSLYFFLSKCHFLKFYDIVYDDIYCAHVYASVCEIWSRTTVIIAVAILVHTKKTR